LSDVSSHLSDGRLDNNLHLTALGIGAPAATGAALEVPDDAHYFLHNKASNHWHRHVWRECEQ